MGPTRASGIERLLFNVDYTADVDRWLELEVRCHLSAGVDRVLFRAGRVDAVFGLVLSDGREIVVKVHRPPVDRERLAALAGIQNALAHKGFPCAEPLAGPLTWGEHTVSVETLLNASAPGNAHLPDNRRMMASSLADMVQLLKQLSLPTDLGTPPAWAAYQNGPWPLAHDSLFDFSRPVPSGWEWLDGLAARAAEVLNEDDAGEAMLGHSDWTCENVRFADGSVGGVYDLDLIFDSEPVIAGMAASAHTSGSCEGGNTPTPGEVQAFLTDYDNARRHRFTDAQQRQAVAAATWTLAYNGRCGLSVLSDQKPATWSPLMLLDLHRDAYLAVRW